MVQEHPRYSWKWLLVALPALIVISSLLRTLWQSYQSWQEVRRETAAVEQLEDSVRELELEVQSATSSFTLEKRTREELQLQQPDEVVIPVR